MTRINNGTEAELVKWLSHVSRWALSQTLGVGGPVARNVTNRAAGHQPNLCRRPLSSSYLVQLRSRRPHRNRSLRYIAEVTDMIMLAVPRHRRTPPPSPRTPIHTPHTRAVIALRLLTHKKISHIN